MNSFYVASEASVRSFVKALHMVDPYASILILPDSLVTDIMERLQIKQPQLIKECDKEALFRLNGYLKSKWNGYRLCSKALVWCLGLNMLIV